MNKSNAPLTLLRFTTILLLICSNSLFVNGQEDDQVNTLGAHFGVVHGLITFSKDTTTNISDFYSVGFPMGITVKKSDNFAFDMEFVPFIDEQANVNLVIHPGALFPLGSNFTLGVRGAFEINPGSTNYGLTPLLNKAFPMKGNYAFFTNIKT